MIKPVFEKEAQAHAIPVIEQKYGIQVDSAASLIIDIEAIYLENYVSGLADLDILILNHCKQAVNELFEVMGLYNTSLQHASDIITVDKPLSPLMLSFQPRSSASVNDSPLSVSNDNANVSRKVDDINQALKLSKRLSLTEVRQKYATADDGFLVMLDFPSILPLSLFMSCIDGFIAEAHALSPNELMIAQQFSSLFKVRNENPFWLASNPASPPQSIYLSIQNPRAHSPSYGLVRQLEEIRNSIGRDVLRLPAHAVFEKTSAHPSINGGYISLKLSIIAPEKEPSL